MLLYSICYLVFLGVTCKKSARNIKREQASKKTSGGMFLLCGVNSTSDWLPGYANRVPAPVLWPIRSQNSGHRALRNSEWRGTWRSRAVPGLHPPIGGRINLTRQKHPSRNFDCLLSFSKISGFQNFAKWRFCTNLTKWKIGVTRFILKIQDSNFTCKPNFHRRTNHIVTSMSKDHFFIDWDMIFSKKKTLDGPI